MAHRSESSHVGRHTPKRPRRCCHWHGRCAVRAVLHPATVGYAAVEGLSWIAVRFVGAVREGLAEIVHRGVCVDIDMCLRGPRSRALEVAQCVVDMQPSSSWSARRMLCQERLISVILFAMQYTCDYRTMSEAIRSIVMSRLTLKPQPEDWRTRRRELP